MRIGPLDTDERFVVVDDEDSFACSVLGIDFAGCRRFPDEKNTMAASETATDKRFISAPPVST